MEEGRQEQENQEIDQKQEISSQDVTESETASIERKEAAVDSSAEPMAAEISDLEAGRSVEAEENSESVSNENENESGASEESQSIGVAREQIVEALLFSSESPLSASKIANVVGAVSAHEIRDIIDRLNQKYMELNRSFQVQEIAGGFQMVTKPEYAGYLQQLFKIKSENKLSGAALETLAVIAYKQPVLRAEVEAVRGVSCGEMIRALMEKDLIKIVGRAEELGRPMLYGTTKKFLEVFGLGSLEDLPKVPELLPGVKHTPIVEGEKKEEKTENAAKADDKKQKASDELGEKKSDQVDASLNDETPVSEDKESSVEE
jgi:segregation and condensation protein B